MLTLLRLNQIFRNLIQTTFNWCIKIEALFFHCKNNIEGHIEGISENDMKKRTIWQWRKIFQINGKWQSMGGLAQGSSLGSKRKEWWQKRILQFEKRNERENGNIFSLWLVAAVNLNGGKYMWQIYMANIWQYILAGCRLPWIVGFGKKYARLQFYLHLMHTNQLLLAGRKTCVLIKLPNPAAP